MRVAAPNCVAERHRSWSWDVIADETAVVGVTGPLVVGIDVAEARKGLDLVALDEDRAVVASKGRLGLAEAARLVLHDLRPMLVCVDAPPGWARPGGRRGTERALSARGMSCFTTPADPGDHPFSRWMRAGFAVYRAIEDRYPLYRGGDHAHTAAEVYPAASATLLAGRARGAGEPKGAFRRAVLVAYGVDLRQLPNVDRVDAALAALTGHRALAGHAEAAGHADEGMMLLPVADPEAADALRSHRLEPRRPRRSSPDGVNGTCGCSCGAPVRRRFLPGHDAKLKSSLRQAAVGGDDGAIDRLRQLG